MRPYIRLTDFLDPQERDHARVWIENQDHQLHPGTVIPDGQTEAVVDPTFRDALIGDDTAMIGHYFDARIRALAPYACERLHVEPFTPTHCELEVVKIATGGRFQPHIDDGAHLGARTLSAVWYLHGDGYNPVRGHGGELVIHTNQGPVWVPPIDNSLVMFPSGLTHEIRPVTSGTRYSMSCWVHRAIPS